MVDSLRENQVGVLGTSKDVEKYDVVVIGAGVTGLYAL